MPVEVILPRVDMDMASGRVSRWFVLDGAEVEQGQPLFEMETDKAAMEIEAPGSGRLHRLPIDDEAVPVGSTLAWILRPGEAAVAAAPPPTIERPAATEPPAPVAVDPPVTGTLPATPLARRLARLHDIALTDVRGSGPRTRIQARDVSALVEARTPAPVARPAPTPIPAAVTRPTSAGVLHHAWLRDGPGRPLVLVHGFGADLDGWRPWVAALPTGRPVLAIDLPGHGRSASAATLSLDAFADAVAETVAAALHDAGARSVDLAGHSLGAAVAVRVAERAGFDLRSLLLIAPGGLGPDIDGAFVDGFSRARSEASLAPWLRRLVHDPAALGEGFVRAVARKRDDAAIDAQAAVARAFFPDGTQAFSVRDGLARLTMPVRVVFGTEDRIIPWRHALGFGAVGVHLFDGVGHMPHLEMPPALARIAAETAVD